MEECQECGCQLDEDFDEIHYTEDGDGPFCGECIEEVESQRAEVAAARRFG